MMDDDEEGISLEVSQFFVSELGYVKKELNLLHNYDAFASLVLSLILNTSPLLLEYLHATADEHFTLMDTLDCAQHEAGPSTTVHVLPMTNVPHKQDDSSKVNRLVVPLNVAVKQIISAEPELLIGEDWTSVHRLYVLSELNCTYIFVILLPVLVCLALGFWCVSSSVSECSSMSNWSVCIMSTTCLATLAMAYFSHFPQTLQLGYVMFQSVRVSKQLCERVQLALGLLHEQSLYQFNTLNSLYLELQTSLQRELGLLLSILRDETKSLLHLQLLEKDSQFYMATHSMEELDVLNDLLADKHKLLARKDLVILWQFCRLQRSEFLAVLLRILFSVSESQSSLRHRFEALNKCQSRTSEHLRQVLLLCEHQNQTMTDGQLAKKETNIKSVNLPSALKLRTKELRVRLNQAILLLNQFEEDSTNTNSLNEFQSNIGQCALTIDEIFKLCLPNSSDTTDKATDTNNQSINVTHSITEHKLVTEQSGPNEPNVDQMFELITSDEREEENEPNTCMEDTELDYRRQAKHVVKELNVALQDRAESVRHRQRVALAVFRKVPLEQIEAEEAGESECMKSTQNDAVGRAPVPAERRMKTAANTEHSNMNTLAPFQVVHTGQGDFLAQIRQGLNSSTLINTNEEVMGDTDSEDSH